jgi:hypothetical protein
MNTYFKHAVLVSTFFASTMVAEDQPSLQEGLSQTLQESARRKQYILEQLSGFLNLGEEQQRDLSLIVKLLIVLCDKLVKIDMDGDVDTQLGAIHDQFGEVVNLLKIKTVNTKAGETLAEQLRNLIEYDKQLDVAERTALISQAQAQLEELQECLGKLNDPYAVYKKMAYGAASLVAGYGMHRILDNKTKRFTDPHFLISLGYGALIYHGVESLVKFAKYIVD